MPPVDWPEAYQRPLGLADADGSRLDVAGALNLLTESGLAAEFDDLLRHAADLGLSVDVVAAIVRARLLGGPLGEFLSGERKWRWHPCRSAPEKLRTRFERWDVTASPLRA